MSPYPFIEPSVVARLDDLLLVACFEGDADMGEAKA